MAELERRRHNIFWPSISRSPKGRERAVLAKRCDRLRAMQTSVDAATEHLRLLPSENSLDALRLRHGFVRLTVGTTKDASDRAAPPLEYRPSATRLLSPNGIALKFCLIALLEAQARTKPGTRPGDNPWPLRGNGSQRGWTDFVATGAVNTGSGRGRSSAVDKNLRQVQSALKRLHAEHLVDLPNAAARHKKYEGFLLNREDGRRQWFNDLYRVPDDDREFFTVPLTLFTRGWIYVLQDSELALLLITARNRSLHGAEEQPLRGGTRVTNHGLGPDAFEAHRVLDYLGLIDVSSDYRRQEDGRVADYETEGAEPHRLLFHPDALEHSAVPTFLAEIEDQLAKPQPADDGSA
ncbi:MAG: hypothetical protein JXO22_10990 [Phycisphaerae bacterium]|nr:hypothetical protein [Phycisphaerae bacterium]